MRIAVIQLCSFVEAYAQSEGMEGTLSARQFKDSAAGTRRVVPRRRSAAGVSDAQCSATQVGAARLSGVSRSPRLKVRLSIDSSTKFHVLCTR